MKKAGFAASKALLVLMSSFVVVFALTGLVAPRADWFIASAIAGTLLFAWVVTGEHRPKDKAQMETALVREGLGFIQLLGFMGPFVTVLLIGFVAPDAFIAAVIVGTFLSAWIVAGEHRTREKIRMETSLVKGGFGFVQLLLGLGVLFVAALLTGLVAVWSGLFVAAVIVGTFLLAWIMPGEHKTREKTGTKTALVREGLGFVEILLGLGVLFGWGRFFGVSLFLVLVLPALIVLDGSRRMVAGFLELIISQEPIAVQSSGVEQD